MTAMRKPAPFAPPASMPRHRADTRRALSRKNRGFVAPRPASGRAPALPDPALWRASFAATWRRFLLSHWGQDPERIAAVFGVRTQTARNWLDGLHRPTGDVVALAMIGWRAEILRAALVEGGAA